MPTIETRCPACGYAYLSDMKTVIECPRCRFIPKPPDDPYDSRV